MADIITYPENGITYDADDASGFLSTRLSGVYSAEEDFSVTAQGGLSVQVSAGQAWVRPARFKGRSIIMEQPTTVVLTEADPVRSRIDRIVLRYDAAAKKTRLQVLDGTPDSAAPAAPAISRTELVYDLCLAEIRRPAGSTSVTAADITDTRADAALCGLMRDGVTGIPVNAMGAQALAKAKETAALCDALLQSYTGGYLGIWPVTLTTSGWAKSTDLPSYPYKQTAELRAARESSRPEAVPALDSFNTAIAAGIAGVCETKDGTITFWAEEVPEQDILMQVTLLGKMTAENQQEA